MTRRLIVFCGVLALLATLGCGNRGPLYLPQADDAAPQQASEKEDEQ
jgi:predicted small lipoprotein YifL